MATKYFYVPYRTTDEDDFTRNHGLIVRATDKRRLLQALDEEAKEGSVPPELVDAMEQDVFSGDSVELTDDMGYYLTGTPLDQPEDEEWESVTWLLSYGDPRPHPSLEAAMGDARSERVDSPHLYRLDARGGLQAISIGSKVEGAEGNPGRKKNSHDPIASTGAMLTSMFHGVQAIDDAHKAKRDNDLRAALGTAQWELGQAWTHGEYASLSAQDKADARSYLYEIGMLVHEWIADGKRPTAAQVNEARIGAERLAEFVSGSRRVANPRGTRR